MIMSMSGGNFKVGGFIYFDRSLVEGLTPSKTGLRNGPYRIVEIKDVNGDPCFRLHNSIGDNRFYGLPWFKA